METCKVVDLLYLLLHLAVDIINLLGCPALPLTKLASICKLSELFTHGHFYSALTFLLPFQVCYVMFWDEITMTMQEAQRQEFGVDHYMSKCPSIMVKCLPLAGSV